MANYKIIIQKEEEPEDVKNNPYNPVVIERDKDERESKWEFVNELVDAAKRRYVAGKEPLEESLINTLKALADEYKTLKNEKLKPYRSEIEEDLERRREEEEEKDFL